MLLSGKRAWRQILKGMTGRRGNRSRQSRLSRASNTAITAELLEDRALLATIVGGDYAGGNLAPADGDVLQGAFTNVGSFVVAPGTTVYVGEGIPLSVAADSIAIAGTLDGDGAGFDGGSGGIGNAGNGVAGNGPGAGQGGLYGSAIHASGGGGAGYGGPGGNSGQSLSNPPAALGGGSYGVTAAPGIQMGSGGGGAGNHGTTSSGIGGSGGDGGGAIALSASIIDVSGAITVDGRDGVQGTAFGIASASSGGGGAGGGIWLDGYIVLNGSLSASGGNGSNFAAGTRLGYYGQGGGGGGGGRIKISGTIDTTSVFTTSVEGGSAGSSDTQTRTPARIGQSGSFSNTAVAVDPNSPPIPDAGAPYTADEGFAITFNASGSTDPDNNIASYAWDLDNDGQFDDAAGVTPTVTGATLVSLGLGDDGYYPIAVRVTDTDGESAVATSTLTINNVTPELENIAITSVVSENDSAILTAEIVDPGSLDVFTLVVDWGEGAPETFTIPAGSTTFTVTHQFLDDNPTGTASAPYNVEILSFTDDDGGSAGLAQGGSIFLTGHDILSHGNQNRYSEVALDYLRGAGTTSEIPRSSYHLGVIAINVDSLTGGSVSNGQPGVAIQPWRLWEPRVTNAFGGRSTFTIGAGTSAAQFESFLNTIDVLVIPEHGLANNIAKFNSFTPEIEAFFNAGGDPGPAHTKLFCR
ncbi:PKD domain-containing protein [Fuerstiella marisgermanici]|uniref:PKD domain-containing protein n=1 Tax=Fuerstiella marisgermanici TaxID=1891926 RepID=A0A1P8WQS2_9PLAN|nr:PKD domain-containing protein [Fuerstiella marisgermanici]APZ96402.1 hypothetical protein Fuma_06071 [Fuerstiella marisgermanici]